jgi:hypothetical protein
MFQNRCPSLEGNNCNKRANNKVAGKLKGISFAETYKTGGNQVSSVVLFFLRTTSILPRQLRRGGVCSILNHAFSDDW